MVGWPDIVLVGLLPPRVHRCCSQSCSIAGFHLCCRIGHHGVRWLRFLFDDVLNQCAPSEQLIPMFGLTALMRAADPEHTFEKVLFIVEHAFTQSNWLTTTISFTALGSLVALRSFKNLFKNTWWIYRLPEVLIVVVVSTSEPLLASLFCLLTCFYPVLSSEFRWDKDGVDILGAVSISTGNSFIEFPLKKSNLKLLHRTTSTAV